MSATMYTRQGVPGSFTSIGARQTFRPLIFQAPHLASSWPGCSNAPHNRLAAASQVEVEALVPALPSSTTTVDLSDMIIRDAGPPRLLSPLPSFLGQVSPIDRSTLPLMIYLPGIDGTGLAAARQFPRLLQYFDLAALITPPEDRSKFETLVEVVASFLEAEVLLHPPTRPVYLLGESFGGVLALAVGARCPGLVDRLVLINPATSFEDSLWPLLGPILPQVPGQMYNALPIALAPVLGNPVNLLQAALDGASPDASIADNLAALVRGAGRLLGQLPLLAELLPPETLAWKLQLLQQGCAAVGPILGSVPQRVLLVVGDQDLLIPSKEEGKFLQKQLRRAHLRVERGRSHALLQEGGVDLVAIMQEEGALVHSRRMSARLTKRAKGSGFGSAAPIELPTEVELKRYADRTTAFGRRLASPVFLSTSPSGDVCMGLGNLPTPGNGPVLFVGNHQTLALDLGVLCEELLKEQGIMVRGLAHPVIFGNTLQTSPAPTNPQQPSSTTSGAAEGQGSLSPFDIIPTFGQLLAGNGPNIPFLPFNNGGRARREQATDGRQAFADFMVEFGAVPVSGRNMARLLQNGESVLLFPGGVREAYRRKGEEYRLFWPKRAEFVRMAAKWGATIVPFAAVGVDDSLDILLDADELRRAPILGQMVANRASKLPRARRGVTAVDEDDQEEAFVSPLAVPKFPPRRMYFLFQKPIATRKEDMEDRARVEELYAEVKGSVEGGLEYLLRRRAEDPYENFQKRVFYEAASGGRPAPTFPLH